MTAEEVVSWVLQRGDPQLSRVDSRAAAVVLELKERGMLVARRQVRLMSVFAPRGAVVVNPDLVTHVTNHGPGLAEVHLVNGGLGILVQGSGDDVASAIFGPGA